MEERILREENVVIRHSAIEIAEHWLIAVSGLLLLFSGFGEFPMYKRFMVTHIPGLGWAGDFWIHLKIHYLAAIVFVSVFVFHIIYHGLSGHRGLLPRRGDVKTSVLTILSFFGIGEEPKTDKYLPEQRLAYLFIGAVSLVLIVTGLVKIFKNLPTIYLPPTLISWATLIHTFTTFLFLFGFLAHIAALVLKVNRPLVRSIFTGKVDLEYVRHRHSLWYDELVKRLPPEDKKEVEGTLDGASEQTPATTMDMKEEPPTTVASVESDAPPDTAGGEVQTGDSPLSQKD